MDYRPIPKQADVVIVGGGVVGSAVAYYLARRGLKPLLLERNRLAGEASGAAAGMLAALAEMEETGPLYELARRSRDLFPELAVQLRELTGIDIALMRRGMLKVAQTPEQVDKLRATVAFQRESGEEVRWLDGQEARECEPALSSDVIGAVDIAGDGQLSAPSLSLAFAQAAVALGAEVYEHCEVLQLITEQRPGVSRPRIVGVETDAGTITSEHVVITSGVWSSRLLERSGIRLPLYPVKGELFSVISHRPLIHRTIFADSVYVVPKGGGRLIVGATMVPHRFDRAVSYGGISQLMQQAQKILPGIVETEWERAWTGIRPQTPDGLPYIGPFERYEGLYAAAGHFRNGILLSPITGQTIANLIASGTEEEELKPFYPERVQEVIT